MYKSYKILTMTVNVKGGEDEKVDHLYKEVEGKLVPMTENESILEMLDRTAKLGKNASVQHVRALLINPNGEVIRTEEVKNAHEPVAE